jgi:hypothetical protein
MVIANASQIWKWNSLNYVARVCFPNSKFACLLSYQIIELTLYFIFHMFKEYLIEGWNKYTLLKDPVH